MEMISIDHSRCKKAGLCAKVCPNSIFVQREKLTIPELMDGEGCIANPLFRTLALLADRELVKSGLHEIPGFKRMIQMFESGTDPILHGAAVLLALHARRTIGFADINAQLALQNASLVAHSLGIGHFYTGWVVSPCRAPMARAWNRRIPGLIGIPPGNTLHGVLALGYPIPRFKNMIQRKPPKIRWA